MRIGIIGLGKMGGNMAKRLLLAGHEVVGHNRTAPAMEELAAAGGVAAETVDALVAELPAPRTIWIMIPAGDPVEEMIDSLQQLLVEGDLIVDGGNSNYKDTVRRGRALAKVGIEYADVGTSGGIWGLAEGYSMMAGGTVTAMERLRPALESLAPAADLGWGHVGPTGSGHFVKMVHNGIEYGMMQAFTEGFALMRKKEEFGLDLAQVAEIWRHGSVVRSWLLDLLSNALKENPEMEGIEPWVADSGEGRWTVKEAIDLDVPAPVATLALIARLRSRDEESYSDRLLSALRNQFGGHAIKRED